MDGRRTGGRTSGELERTGRGRRYITGRGPGGQAGPDLVPHETVFVLSGLAPNRRSHPLVYEWIGVAYLRDGSVDGLAVRDTSG